MAPSWAPLSVPSRFELTAGSHLGLSEALSWTTIQPALPPPRRGPETPAHVCARSLLRRFQLRQRPARACAHWKQPGPARLAKRNYFRERVSSFRNFRDGLLIGMAQLEEAAPLTIPADRSSTLAWLLLDSARGRCVSEGAPATFRLREER